MDKDTIAQAMGLAYHEYDTALDQNWVDDVIKTTGKNPIEAGFVWSYQTSPMYGRSVLGYPVPLTADAARLLADYSTLRGIHIERGDA